MMEGSVVDPLAQARDLLQAGALAEAEQLVRRSLMDQPSSAVALTLAGQIDLRRSALDKAARHFSRATRAVADPDPRPLLNLARVLDMAGRSAEALESARQAAARYPDDARPRALLALLSLQSGQVSNAIAALKPVNPDRLDPDTAFKIARELFKSSDAQDLAVRLVKRAAATPGRFLEPALQLLSASLKPEDERRHKATRRQLIMAPDSVPAMDQIEQEYDARRYPVRQAAWLCRSTCLRVDDLPRIERAAELAHQVKWPSHGLAVNRILLTRKPGRWDLIVRIGELFERHHELSADADKPTARRQAVEWARSILATNPKDPRIWDAIVGLYKAVEDVEEAARLWPQILKRFPSFKSLHYNYGLFLDDQNDIHGALRSLKNALLLAPDYPKASNLLSMTMTRVHDLPSAMRYVRWAITGEPTRVSCWLNYGSHLRALGQYMTAMQAYERAQTLAEAQKDKDQGASARFNRGMTYVTMGELEVGFKLLEARWATPAFPSPKRSFRQAIWKGPQVHPQANLLCYMEQGMGDEVMLSWYFPLLRQDTKRLVVDCDERLVALFQRTYEGIEFVPRSVAGDPRTRDPDLQFKVPVLHTPQYYVPQVRFLTRANWHWAAARGTRFPARLVLEPERLAKWDNWLEERFPGRPRLSLSWRSKIRNRMRNQQYLNTEELAEALPDGVVGINLQYSSTEDEVAELQEYCRPRGIDIVTPEGVDLTNDLEDIFALLQVSDAAVTPMISLAWMAGAVGCPGYIFRTSRERIIWQQFCLPFVTWAPSLRLFFRDPSETWDATTRELNSQLTAFLARGSGRERLTFG